MNEQEKIESYLSSVRHDLRTQLMVVREGASIILDNIVGSNCDSCFALLRPALESTNELNKLIGEFLSTPRLVKLLAPMISAKEEETLTIKKDLLRNREEVEKLKERLEEKEEELRCEKREILRREEELKTIRREASGK